MSQHSTHQHQAKQLLRDYVAYFLHTIEAIDTDATPEQFTQAQQRLHRHQGYLIDVIAAGLKSGDVLF